MRTPTSVEDTFDMVTAALRAAADRLRYEGQPSFSSGSEMENTMLAAVTKLINAVGIQHAEVLEGVAENLAKLRPPFTAGDQTNYGVVDERMGDPDEFSGSQHVTYKMVGDRRIFNHSELRSTKYEGKLNAR